MDNEILKLFPQKAFKLLSIKDSIRIGSSVTSSLVNKKLYDEELQKRINHWKLPDISIVKELQISKKIPFSKNDGELILQVYFTQFFDSETSVHLDYRNAFVSAGNAIKWKPSRLQYKFSNQFLEGVRLLYSGFYFDNQIQFEQGLTKIGIIQQSASEKQKKDIIELFTKYFGDGRLNPVHFSLTKLKNSFNEIFTFFLKEDIPLNPEFAVLGIALVTLYSVLEDIPEEIDVRSSFIKASSKL